MCVCACASACVGVVGFFEGLLLAPDSVLLLPAAAKAFCDCCLICSSLSSCVGRERKERMEGEKERGGREGGK